MRPRINHVDLKFNALNRQGTQQQRPETLTETPPSIPVNTGWLNSTEGTSKEDVVLVESMYPIHPKRM